MGRIKETNIGGNIPASHSNPYFSLPWIPLIKLLDL
jgi:hypothetical protein